jgi:hypothetical protein
MDADQAAERDTLALMTIASHCLSLIREHGPLSADELGAACREAGVTASRQPASAVASALSWYQDGRAFRVRDRFHTVAGLLEGRWLTFHAPDVPTTMKSDLDLACLKRLVERDGLPLAGGGTVRADPYDGTWTGPDGWLPAGETLGLKLIGGAAHLSAVVLDDAAVERGARLAELLGLLRSQGYLGMSDHVARRATASEGLLSLLAKDDDLLRDPVPPLSSLLPAPAEVLRRSAWAAPPPFWRAVEVRLSPELYERFDDAAGFVGEPVGRWLEAQLEWLADWPRILTGADHHRSGSVCPPWCPAVDR